MKEILKKLSSRKLIVCLIGIIVGIATSCGVSENEYSAIAGNITIILSVVSYIIGEAKIDAASAGKDTLNVIPIPKENDDI